MRKIINDHRSSETGHIGKPSPATTKKLTLHRETLRVLTAPDLHRIAGGKPETSGRCYTPDPTTEQC